MRSISSVFGVYIRFYFSFLTLWTDDEDGPNVDTVDTEFTITMCSMRGWSLLPRSGYERYLHEMHEIRGAFLLSEI